MSELGLKVLRAACEILPDSVELAAKTDGVEYQQSFSDSFTHIGHFPYSEDDIEKAVQFARGLFDKRIIIEVDRVSGQPNALCVYVGSPISYIQEIL